MNDGVLTFRDRELSWVGYCPWNDKPCYGTEDGSVFFATSWPKHESESQGELPFKIFDGEAINGIAFSKDLMAVSCRSEVSVFRRDYDASNGQTTLALDRFISPFAGGAHGVINGADGGFIAPLGSDGLLFMRREQAKGLWQISKIPEKSMNFYRLVSLDITPEGEVLVAATRSGGVFAMTLQDGIARPPVVAHGSPDIDIIDVCGLGSDAAPRAVVALNRDGRLFWARDVLDIKSNAMITWGGLEGRPYSLFSRNGHVSILTSEKLIVLPDLARRLLDGHDIRGPQVVVRLTTEAADAYLLPDDRFYIVEDGQVPIFSLHGMIEEAKHGRAANSAGEPRSFDPSYNQSAVGETGLRVHTNEFEMSIDSTEPRTLNTDWAAITMSFDAVTGA